MPTPATSYLFALFIIIRRPPRATLFPYTTRFRSGPNRRERSPHGAGQRTAESRRSARAAARPDRLRSEEHTSELQSHVNLVCRLLLEKKKENWFRSMSPVMVRTM